jgi:hypothetical protein
MKFPSKVTSYKKSVLSKFPIVLNVLEKESKTPIELYKKVKNKVENVAEFIQILDCLFALNMIEMHNGRIVIYVKTN